MVGHAEIFLLPTPSPVPAESDTHSDSFRGRVAEPAGKLGMAEGIAFWMYKSQRASTARLSLQETTLDFLESDPENGELYFARAELRTWQWR